METFDIEGNELSGDISSLDFSKVAPSLTQFLISDNKFTGTIPSTLQMLGQLKLLWMKNNSLSGTIPTELMKLTNISKSRYELDTIPMSYCIIINTFFFLFLHLNQQN